MRSGILRKPLRLTQAARCSPPTGWISRRRYSHRKRSRREVTDARRFAQAVEGTGARIIDKTGPLDNYADRDHCIQYMVAVPFFCPDTPPLQENPVFLYYSDRFQKPNPFPHRADDHCRDGP